MLISRTLKTIPLKLTIQVSPDLLARLEALRARAKNEGWDFNLEPELVRFISASLTRAESVLRNQSSSV